MESKDTKKTPRSEKSRALVKKLCVNSPRFLEDDISDKVKDKICDAKKKHRTEIKPEDWEKGRFAEVDWGQKLLDECPDQIERLNAEDLTVDDFFEKYEKTNKPVIIRNIVQHWGSESYWTFENLYQKYKNVKFKIGEDDDGNKIRIKFKYFMEYLIYQKDDSPLYLFESLTDSNEETKEFKEKYSIPKYFADDYFKIVGEEKRPPYKWLLIGPERSGTTIHIDPIMTSAWNTSLQGHKRWILFPEDIPKSIVKGKEFITGSNNLGFKREFNFELAQDDEAIHYFTQILPKIKQKEGKWLREIEFIQYPGEMVFIPGGWWHAVINIDSTMAITHNFMSRVNFDRVWKSMRRGRKKLACKFLERLKELHPDLYERAVELNKRDKFMMYDELMAIRTTPSETLSEVRKKIKGNSDTSSYSSSSTSSSSSSDSSDSS